MPWSSGDSLNSDNLNNSVVSNLTTTERLYVSNDLGASTPLSVLSTNNNAAFIVNTNNAWDGISIYPPEAHKRNKIQLFQFQNDVASDLTVRAIGIESHGTADGDDPTNQHVTFYSTDGVDSRKVIQWHWGSQWTSMLSTLEFPSVERVIVGWPFDGGSDRTVSLCLSSNLTLQNAAGAGVLGVSGAVNISGSSTSDVRERLVVTRPDAGDVWVNIMPGTPTGKAQLLFNKENLSTAKIRGRVVYDCNIDELQLWTSSTLTALSADSAGNVATLGAVSVASQTQSLPSTVSSRGYFWVDSASSLYWVNGSGVSTLVV